MGTGRKDTPPDPTDPETEAAPGAEGATLRPMPVVIVGSTDDTRTPSDASVDLGMLEGLKWRRPDPPLERSSSAGAPAAAHYAVHDPHTREPTPELMPKVVVGTTSVAPAITAPALKERDSSDPDDESLRSESDGPDADDRLASTVTCAAHASRRARATGPSPLRLGAVDTKPRSLRRAIIATGMAATLVGFGLVIAIRAPLSRFAGSTPASRTASTPVEDPASADTRAMLNRVPDPAPFAPSASDPPPLHAAAPRHERGSALPGEATRPSSTRSQSPPTVSPARPTVTDPDFPHVY